MDPGWLSKAYLVYDEPGGTAVFVDSGAPLEPLLAAVERARARRSRTCSRRTATRTTSPGTTSSSSASRARSSRGRSRRAACASRRLPTPGHSDDGVAFVANGEAVFTGDTLFKNSVGGGDFETVKRSVMDVLMTLPHELRVYPGHTDETTIGDEWESNPFVRVWRGAEPEGTEPVHGRRRGGDARSSGRPTTTARARPGCASPTAVTPSSAARAYER